MKIKQMLLALCLVTLTSNAFSQTEEKRGYIGISIGPSAPLGDFASKDANNDAAGYAKTGAILDINFAYRLANHFGVTALLRGQTNNIDAQSLADQVANANGGTWTVNTDSWSIGGLMGGIYGSFPMTEKAKTVFEVRGLVGFLSATSPKLHVESADGWYEQTSEDATAFSYLLGAGFRFNISPKIGILANADYMGAKPEFQDVRYIDSSGASETGTYSQSFGTFNVGVGVAFRLK